MKNSKECREYLKARYSHVCIDEYQDCDEKKHDNSFIGKYEDYWYCYRRPNQSILLLLEVILNI